MMPRHSALVALVAGSTIAVAGGTVHVLADRSQFFKELTTPFYGANRPTHKDEVNADLLAFLNT